MQCWRWQKNPQETARFSLVVESESRESFRNALEFRYNGLMRQTTFCFIGFLLAVLISSPLSGARAIEPQDLFQQLDSNSDGRLVRDEIPADREPLFRRMLRTGDADGDNALTSQEFSESLHSERPTKPIVRKPREILPGSAALLFFLAKMDTNADRTILADEVPERFKPFFAEAVQRVGGDQDQQLRTRELIRASPQLSRLAIRTAEEMDLDVELELALLPERQWKLVLAMMLPRRASAMLGDRSQIHQLFERFDTDGDNQLSAEELPTPLASRLEGLLAHFDEDDNDKFSRHEILELAAYLHSNSRSRSDSPESRQIDQVLRRLDQNGDEMIRIEEVPDQWKNLFPQADANHNGVLNRAELSHLVAKLRQLRKLPSPDDAPMQQDGKSR